MQHFTVSSLLCRLCLPKQCWNLTFTSSYTYLAEIGCRDWRGSHCTLFLNVDSLQSSASGRPRAEMRYRPTSRLPLLSVTIQLESRNSWNAVLAKKASKSAWMANGITHYIYGITLEGGGQSFLHHMLRLGCDAYGVYLQAAQTEPWRSPSFDYFQRTSKPNLMNGISIQLGRL